MARAPIGLLGVPLLNQRAGEWGERLMLNFGRELVNAADRVVEAAKRDAPVKDGHLRSTIKRDAGVNITKSAKTALIRVGAGGTSEIDGRQVNYAGRQHEEHRTKRKFIQRNVLAEMRKYPGTLRRTFLSTRPRP